MLDLIDRIGPAGHFMAEEETASRCRAEIWAPKLMDRNGWDGWKAAGSQTMQDRIRARLHEILATHEPLPLSNEVAERIESILQEAEAREAAQGSKR